MKLFQYGCLFLVLFSSLLIHAQEATEEPTTGWEIIERCVGEPTILPDDWTFDGTILASGWAGIHGINADWDTARVLAFDDNWIYGDGGSGTVSPDGRWFVVAEGQNLPIDGELFYRNIEIQSLNFYDLTDRENVIRLSWEDRYEVYHGGGYTRLYDYRTPVWYNTDTAIYQQGEQFFLIYLPELIVEEWTEPQSWGEISPVWLKVSFPSPDWSRIVTRDREYAVFNTESLETLASTYNPIAGIDGTTIAWHPDSTEFISGDSIFDADGNLLEILDEQYNVDEVGIFVSENSYSPNGQYFWAHLFMQQHTNQNTIAIANRLEQIIFDTCIDTSDVHFSPDSQMIAMWESVPNQQEQLQILDLETWQLFNTGIYHEGRIIGWHEDT